MKKLILKFSIPKPTMPAFPKPSLNGNDSRAQHQKIRHVMQKNRSFLRFFQYQLNTLSIQSAIQTRLSIQALVSLKTKKIEEHRELNEEIRVVDFMK